jgi:hypothetical protein
MTDWPHSKQIASEIVRGWMLQDAIERKMDALVKDIEAELTKAFANGQRAGEAAALERAAKVAEEPVATEERTVYLTRQKIAAAIRVMKEQP